jgi:hypothetical protein
MLGVVCALLMPCPPALAADTGAPKSELIVVTGLGGEEYYSALFHRWAAAMVDTAAVVLGLDHDRITYLAEDPERDSLRIDGVASRESLATALEVAARRARPGDALMLLMIGHGTARDGRVLFNIPGPDVSASDLNLWLHPLDGQRVAVVIASSASGPFVAALAGTGRVVISATANAGENQHARFGGHFVSAFEGLSADMDKDGRVSLLEAFESSKRLVRRSYENERLLQTEHALLDDDGDGVGALIPDRGGPDGRKAARWFLAPLPVGPEEGAEQRLALQVEARALVDQLERLKRDKVALSRSEYQPRLEELLVKLALNRRELRKIKP